MIKLTDLQLQSIKRIYDEFIDFLYEFNSTDGFNNLWFKYQGRGSNNPESDIYDYVEQLEKNIQLVIDKEYFYLHDLPIYNELINFLDEDIYNSYNGKLEYAYRFEAPVDGNPTTREDYEMALNKLNSIIEKYN